MPQLHRLIALVCILILSTLTASAQDDSDIYVDSCPFPLPDSEIEGQTIDCAYFVVPEDYDNPGTEIEIAFAILYSPNPNYLPDPLVYLVGGPGGSALDEYDYWATTPFRADRDIILIDQRGAGYSYPRLVCDIVEEVSAEETDFAALEDCYNQILDAGFDPSEYNSINNARDIAALLDALDYDSYNLLGISYGTRLALTILRDHPDPVRSVILDSSYPPVVDAYEESAVNTYRAFSQMFRDCEAESACNAAYPNLEDRFLTLVVDLDNDPVALPDDYGDLTGDLLLSDMFDFLYDTGVLPYLPKMIDELTRGDTDTYIGIMNGEIAPTEDNENYADDIVYEFVDEFFYLSDEMSDEEYFAMWDEIDAISNPDTAYDELLDVIYAYFYEEDAAYLEDLLGEMSDDKIDSVFDELYAEDVSDSDGMFTSFECVEEMPFNDLADMEQIAANNVIPDVFVEWEIAGFEDMAQTCDIWQVTPAPAIEDEAIISDIPTLIVAGGYDPITPPAWGELAAQTLSHSFYFEFPGVGHSVIDGGDCPVEMMLAFLDDPTQAPDSDCIAAMGIDFVTD